MYGVVFEPVFHKNLAHVRYTNISDWQSSGLIHHQALYNSNIFQIIYFLRFLDVAILKKFVLLRQKFNE